MAWLPERRKHAEKLEVFLNKCRNHYLVVATGLAIFCIILTVTLGQDINFDQLNYHMLSADNLLRGRSDIDFAVAQRQSWLNPIPNVLSYWVVTGLPPLAAMLALALISVTAPLAAYVTIHQVLRPATLAEWIMALACLFVGLTNYVSLMIIGTTYNESWVPALMTGGLLCCVMAVNGGSRTLPWVAGAGLLLGVAAGFKVTNLPFALGGFVGLALLCCRHALPWKALAVYLAVGGVAAFASGGWWLIHVYRGYGDPFYPLFAKALHSRWAAGLPLPEEHFRPTALYQLISDPWSLALGRSTGVISTVVPARDGRPLLLLLSLLVLGAAYGVRMLRGRMVDRGRLFLVTACLVAYIAWWAIFDIERYMTTGYLLCGLFMALAVIELGPAGKPAQQAVTLGLLGLLIVTTHPIRTGRAKLSADWYDLTVPPSLVGNGSLYVMAGDGPMGWLALKDADFGPGTHFIRVDGNFPIDPGSRLGQRMAGAIAARHGAIRSLVMLGAEGKASQSYAAYGLAESADCAEIGAKPGPMRSCVLTPLHRLP